MRSRATRQLSAARARLEQLRAERDEVQKALETASAGLGALVARGEATDELHARVARFRARLAELDAGVPVAAEMVAEAEAAVAEEERRGHEKRARALAKKRRAAADRLDAALVAAETAWTEFRGLCREHAVAADRGATSGALPAARLSLLAKAALLGQAPELAATVGLERVPATHRRPLAAALTSYDGEDA